MSTGTVSLFDYRAVLLNLSGVKIEEGGEKSTGTWSKITQSNGTLRVSMYMPRNIAL